ncbi:MAG: hypothetical protein ABW034_02650 [Steroidobacteraceae bacterium]
MWKASRYEGVAVPFAPIVPADEYLHPATAEPHFTDIETNLYGFNIPAEDIQSNIYVLWHPLLRTMSIQIFVYRGRRVLPHQLAADYFQEQLFLPAVTDNSDWRMQMGSCSVRFQILQPLERILIEIEDPRRRFALNLRYDAAMPPVGRPGGKHFTQLMKTSGELTLDGKRYGIDGLYVRDRSWGYRRPEEPESVPPYRWMTGWFGADSAFVAAWMDTGLLDSPEFGPDWNRMADGRDATGANKWESGGKTPSLNFRSGWFAVDGTPRPVVRMDVRTLSAEPSQLQVKAIELELEDSSGEVHRIRGDVLSLIPKMYWQNLLVYMHCVELKYGQRTGHGDLMDTYSTHHVRRHGI